jgi:putative endonuclease
MSKNSQALGKAGEDFAAQQLAAQGYQILARNWRFGKIEADIIAWEGGDLVVVEVRTRYGEGAGELAMESITPAKYKKLHQLAGVYYAQAEFEGQRGLRIDLAAVQVKAEGFTLEVLRNIEMEMDD